MACKEKALRDSDPDLALVIRVGVQKVRLPPGSARHPASQQASLSLIVFLLLLAAILAPVSPKFSL